MNKRLMIDGTYIDMKNLIIINPALLKNNLDDVITLALTDIKKYSSLAVYLYLVTMHREVSSIKKVQIKCNEIFVMAANTFIEGIADLFRCGYLKQHKNAFELVK